MSLQTVDAPPARPSRRSIAAGMAWAVPVIAVGAAAPRAAASPCNPQAYTISWGGAGGSTYTRGGDQSGIAVVDPDGSGPVAPVTLTMSSTFAGRMRSGNESSLPNQNFRVSATPVGGSTKVGLQFEQTVTGTTNSTPGRAALQTVTFSFSEPVVGLSFFMSDIDALQGDFIDNVELSGTFTSSYDTTRMQGNGTEGNAFRPRVFGDVPFTSSAGNVTIQYPGAISSFTMTYWNSVGSFSGVDRNQIVTFSDFTFNVLRNNC